MTKNKKEIIEVIKKSKNIALMAHRDGDGDSFGGIIGLYLALKKIGKNIRIYSEGNLPQSLEFLLDNHKITFIDEYWKDADCFIVIDTSGRNIISLPEVADRYLANSEIETVLIDHHEKGEMVNLVNYSWVEQKYCSASEMALELAREMKVEIDSEIATAFLTGIDTDTSSFQNQNTTAKSFASAAYLMDKGARLQTIVQNNFFNHTVEALKTRALVINRLIINKKHDVAISYLLNKDFAGKTSEEISRMISQANFLNTIKGVRMIAFVSEVEAGKIRVSLRTRNEKVDVSKLAKALGGGGHVKAAGFLLEGQIEEKNGQTRIA